MSRRGPQTVDALLARFRVLHGDERAELALRLGRFRAAHAVLEGFAHRIEKTEHTLDVSIKRLGMLREKYAEWLTITLGTATALAQWYDEEGDASGVGWIPRKQSPNVAALLADDDLFPPPVEFCEPPHVRRCASNHCTRATGEPCSVSRETHGQKVSDYNGESNQGTKAPQAPTRPTCRSSRANCSVARAAENCRDQ